MRIHDNLVKRGRQALYLLLVLLTGYGAAAQNEIIVKGVVRSDSAVMTGVTVSVKTLPDRATVTDEKGNYEIKAPANATLVFTFIGYETRELPIAGENVVNALLKQSNQDLEEVAVVAYGHQKKSTLTGAITTIDPKELKGPTSNLTTMLAGRLAGVISYQRSGEPGQDNAQFFIRGITTFGTGKQNPLILIDGMESTTDDLARLQPDDIAGFSILKDAAAASQYGARGANGVVLVITKTGEAGKTKFNIRFENSMSGNTRNFKFADNITYMQLANEAEVARVDNPIEPYSETKIDHTAAGDDPLMYPNNNWLDLLVKDNTNNQRLNVNLSGGGKLARYYISGTYYLDNGVLKENKLNNFNSNIKLKNYSIRSNLDLKVTSTTTVSVKTSGLLNDYVGPVGGGANYFAQALSANPVMFPAIYPQSLAPEIKHPLFGNANDGSGDGYSYANPYANMVSGYQQYNASTLIAQIGIDQDFGFWVPGLSASVMGYTNRYAYFDVSRQYMPFYYQLAYAPGTKDPVLNSLNVGEEYLSYVPGTRTQYTTNYLQAQMMYNRRFGPKHAFTGMLITMVQSRLNATATDLQSSLPYRNQGLSGRFTYAYDNRYRVEFDFGYNGSERFQQNHRYGFFPSISAAWNINSEKFFEPLAGIFHNLKLRGSYGLVGNDQIGSDADRFFYLSNVNMNDASRGIPFGENYNYTQPAITVTRYENDQISWEKSYKSDIGLEIGLWNKLNVQIDVFHEKRTNILMDRTTIPNTMGLAASVKANVGEASGQGMEVQADYNATINKNMWLQARGTFTYATSKLLEAEEPDYPESYRSRVGHSLSQQWGLIAERLFIDDAEVANSPEQQWGRVRAGDIKYRDVNGDGIIEGDGDQVPIGLPTTPEINYGFGFSFGYKNFDFSAFFQGSARSSLFISNSDIQPFYKHDGYENGLLKVIADDHWSEENRNIYAFWPRLSRDIVLNNYWTSTWWMRDGAFLRLKTVELGYNLPAPAISHLHLDNCRLYFNASNLFVLSRFDMWDPEMGGNGLGYPVQRVLNVGLKVGF